MYTLKDNEEVLTLEQAKAREINVRFKSFVAAGATFDFRQHPRIIVRTTSSEREYMKFEFSDGRILSCSALMRSPSDPNELGADNKLAHASSGPEVLGLVWDHVVRVSEIKEALGRDFGDKEERKHKYSVWVIE